MIKKKKKKKHLGSSQKVGIYQWFLKPLATDHWAGCCLLFQFSIPHGTRRRRGCKGRVVSPCSILADIFTESHASSPPPLPTPLSPGAVGEWHVDRQEVTAGLRVLSQVASCVPGACFSFHVRLGTFSFISRRVGYLETLKFSSPLDWALQQFKKPLSKSENHVTP